jgi:hypothetical protein
MLVTHRDLEKWFNEFRPNVSSMVPERNAMLREGAKAFAEVILAVSQPCPEQVRALELVRSAMHCGLDAVTCYE